MRVAEPLTGNPWTRPLKEAAAAPQSQSGPAAVKASPLMDTAGRLETSPLKAIVPPAMRNTSPSKSIPAEVSVAYCVRPGSR